MHVEITKYSTQISLLVAFVEGRLDGAQLDAALVNGEMKSLLGLFENIQYLHSSNHYLRLLEQDRVSLRGLVNTEGIIEHFLQQAEVPFKPARRYGSVYSLILGALPDYLDPPLEFLLEKVVPADENLSDTKKKQCIKERLKQLFKYAEKPPKWLQSAEWPIENGMPLYFIGQVKINAPELFHDNGMAYLFFNPEHGKFETITQFY